MGCTSQQLAALLLMLLVAERINSPYQLMVASTGRQQWLAMLNALVCQVMAYRAMQVRCCLLID
jgi:hypothetical protein